MEGEGEEVEKEEDGEGEGEDEGLREAKKYYRFTYIHNKPKFKPKI